MKGEALGTIDHPIALNIEETRAFHERAWSHVAGVVNLKEDINRSKRTRSERIGTGGAYVWDKKKIVLTAKHVLEGAGPDEVAFLPRTGSSLGWDRPGEINGMSERVTVGIETIVRCTWEDLAAIVLTGERAEELNVEFCELPQRLSNDKTIQGPGSVLVIGFPVDQAFPVS